MSGVVLSLLATSSAGGAAGFPLPAESVLIWDKTSSGTSPPTGFSEISITENSMILGTTLANAGTYSGTTAPVTASGNSTLGGAHPSSPANLRLATSTPSTGTGTTDDTPAPSHNHPITISGTIPTAALPNGQGVKLITNAAQVAAIPQNAIVFSASSFPGFSRKTWAASHAAYVATTATTTSPVSAAAIDLTPATTIGFSGAHKHFSPGSTVRIGGTPSGPGPSTTSASPGTDGSHTHPVTVNPLYIHQTFRHLIPYIANYNNKVQSGMIVMYKGTSAIPSGWTICDGNNGTPNMVDYFLGYTNDTGTAHGAMVGAKVINQSSTSPNETPSGTPTSPYGTSGVLGTLANIPWSHSHAGPSTTLAGVPQGHGTLSVPHGHSFDPAIATSTIPSSFIPKSYRLVFMQKD